MSDGDKMEGERKREREKGREMPVDVYSNTELYQVVVCKCLQAPVNIIIHRTVSGLRGRAVRTSCREISRSKTSRFIWHLASYTS